MDHLDSFFEKTIANYPSPLGGCGEIHFQLVKQSFHIFPVILTFRDHIPRCDRKSCKSHLKTSIGMCFDDLMFLKLYHLPPLFSLPAAIDQTSFPKRLTQSLATACSNCLYL